MEKHQPSDQLTGSGHNSIQAEIKNADSCNEQRMVFPAHAFVCAFSSAVFQTEAGTGFVLMTQRIPSGH